jgi:hypothetical protein
MSYDEFEKVGMTAAILLLCVAGTLTCLALFLKLAKVI